MRPVFSANLTGADVPEEILYNSNARAEDKDAPLTGANEYVLHFDEDKLRPLLCVLKRRTSPNATMLQSTADGLKTDPDGSVTPPFRNRMWS
jgi:hypothetical protein